MISYRRELLLECDGDPLHNQDCRVQLALDDLDAPTKRGMKTVARRLGWTWDAEGNCWCPSCSARGSDPDQRGGG